jgi:hypothetical protein
MEENYINIGKIEVALFSKISTDIITDEVILTNERFFHIIGGHKDDFELYSNMIPNIIKEPDYILKDYKNENTAMIIKQVEETNINIIIKLAISEDKVHKKNSIMTMYRIRNKNLKKLMEKNKTIYKKE